jgi:hypothetical protein
MPIGKTRQTQLEIEAQGWCRQNYPRKKDNLPSLYGMVMTKTQWFEEEMRISLLDPTV